MKRYGKGLVLKAALVLAVLLAAGAPARAEEVRVFTKSTGLPSDSVTALAAAPDGKLWVGTENAGVCLLDPVTGSVKRHGTADGVPTGPVVSIALFRGKVYAGTEGGLAAFDGKRWEPIPKAGGVTMRNVRLAASPDGKELWACAVYLNGGAVRFDGSEWKFMGGEGRGLFNDVQGFAFLPDGVLMASGSGTPYLHKGSDVVALGQGLPPVSLFAAGDLAGKGLVGTSRGLFRFDGSWVPVPFPAGYGDGAVFSIAGRDGDVVVGGASGLFRIRDGKLVAFPEGGGLPSPRVMSVATTGSFVAAGTPSGLAIIRAK
jgi:hypothetical protein